MATFVFQTAVGKPPPVRVRHLSWHVAVAGEPVTIWESAASGSRAPETKRENAASRAAAEPAPHREPQRCAGACGCVEWLLTASLAYMDTIQSLSAIRSARVFSTSAEEAAPADESPKTSLLLEVEDGAGTLLHSLCSCGYEELN